MDPRRSRPRAMNVGSLLAGPTHEAYRAQAWSNRTRSRRRTNGRNSFTAAEKPRGRFGLS